MTAQHVGEMRSIAVLRARLCFSGVDPAPTIGWMRRCAIVGYGQIDEEYDDMLLEIELRDVPQALQRSQQRSNLMVFRITDAGVTFYMMNLDDGPPSSLNRADGQLFVPMSTVISINTFGRIEPKAASSAICQGGCEAHHR